jgi:hypothetical protein
MVERCPIWCFSRTFHYQIQDLCCRATLCFNCLIMLRVLRSLG